MLYWHYFELDYYHSTPVVLHFPVLHFSSSRIAVRCGRSTILMSLLQLFSSVVDILVFAVGTAWQLLSSSPNASEEWRH